MLGTATPPTKGSEGELSSPSRPKLFATIARWGVAIILLGAAVNLALAWQSIRPGATETMRTVAPGWLGIAVVLGIAPWAFTAARAWMWARFFGTPITARNALRVGVGTELGSSISPKAIGGAPVKVGLLVDSGVRTGTAASMLMLDNLVDVVFFAGVAPAIAFATARWELPEVQEVLGRLFDRALATAPWIIGGVVVVATLLWIRRLRVGRDPAGNAGGLRGALSRVRDEFLSAYELVGKRGKFRFVIAVVLTTGLWGARCSVATAVLYGLGAAVDPVLFFLLQWVVFMMMVFVPTPGAALGAEASFGAVVDGFVVEGALGILTAGWRFFSFYLPLLLGLVTMPLLGAKPGISAPAAPAT